MLVRTPVHRQLVVHQPHVSRVGAAGRVQLKHVGIYCSAASSGDPSMPEDQFSKTLRSASAKFQEFVESNQLGEKAQAMHSNLNEAAQHVQQQAEELGNQAARKYAVLGEAHSA